MVDCAKNGTGTSASEHDGSGDAYVSPIEQVVLRRISLGVFEIPDIVPDWLPVSLEGSSIKDGVVTFHDETSFVGCFLRDAENFWNGRKTGIERSELFSADGPSQQEQFFELLAAWAGKQPCLIVEHVTRARENVHQYLRGARRSALQVALGAKTEDSLESLLEQAQNNAVLRSLPDVVMRFDGDGRILGVRFGQDFGLSLIHI